MNQPNHLVECFGGPRDGEWHVYPGKLLGYRPVQIRTRHNQMIWQYVYRPLLSTVYEEDDDGSDS